MEALKKATGYTYWVRQDTQQAAPAPVHRRLSATDIAEQNTAQAPPLGSVWNQAGTWEEKSLNSWALARVKELLLSADTVSFPQGTARVIEVSSCTGDATLVTVRKKKRVGYSFEITIKFNGEITSSGEPKNLEGSVKLLEAAYGELDDLQVEVTLKDRTVPANEKSRVSDAIGKSFLPVLRQQLALFEAELEER
ncbi:hypothetical protein MPTK1_7g04270 [Marchantia polymorpha subsp. ruderalis]|uniref:Activator of Hsp90 ATPase AHSA1-like N-terminal domain-containing protein n=2 Tax=Marchantia polymorpha TaxID=3197 RepID=A0AAF6BW11_MARPO|nr:hypothetical protein MARPO_0062s0098 [Marchantia polymorpha]BBN16195.1 hypothetical protein Mp_7g04270 [Marchantia polymorpha subsp. ruderalis]|eukprot:PTQ36687.1 hypothetical protein MARPO_0062s0098 [Marchantia polymorpha]